MKAELARTGGDTAGSGSGSEASPTAAGVEGELDGESG